MRPPIASPFGDLSPAPSDSWPQPLYWDEQLECFALQYRSSARAKLRCLPKELKRSPVQVLLLFATSPLWFFWTSELDWPLATRVLLALVLALLTTLVLLIGRWNFNKAPGLAMIRSDGLADKFPAKTNLYLWKALNRAFEDDGDLFFYAGATKGSYFPRESFVSQTEAQLFFALVQSLMQSDGATWDVLAAQHAPQLPQR